MWSLLDSRYILKELVLLDSLMDSKSHQTHHHASRKDNSFSLLFFNPLSQWGKKTKMQTKNIIVFQSSPCPVLLALFGLQGDQNHAETRGSMAMEFYVF